MSPFCNLRVNLPLFTAPEYLMEIDSAYRHPSSRGFCPSCGGRRMSQTAAHLVDHVIPPVPVRQWVLSLPAPTKATAAPSR